MRVCHFCASEGMGRGDVYTDLVNHLITRHPEIELALLLPEHAKGLDRIASGVTVLTYRDTGSRRNPLLAWRVAKAIRGFKPDLVHTHFAKATELYRRIYPRVRIPYTATKHNPRKGKVYNKVPRVIAVSQAVADSVTHNRVQVIYNGIKPQPATTTRKSLNDSTLRCLNVGRLEEVKGQDRLIRALAAYDKPWHLRILGEGPYRPTLERLAAELGVEGCVDMPGYDAGIISAMTSCDVFLQGSRSEGFGIALLEAMHYAPLALSTPVGLAGEVFPDAFLWDGDDPDTLHQLLNQLPERREQFAGWTQTTNPRFHQDHTADQHATYYRDLLAGL